MRRRAPDRRPRLRRRLARPGAGRRAARRRTSASSRARSGTAATSSAPSRSRAGQRDRGQRPRRGVAGGARRPRSRHRARARRAAGDPRVRRAAAGGGRAGRGLEGRGVAHEESAAGAAAAGDPRPRTAAGASPSRPFPGARDHTLHAFRKIAPTPERFPRRPGMATKRPLGTLKGTVPLIRAPRCRAALTLGGGIRLTGTCPRTLEAAFHVKRGSRSDRPRR